MRRARIKVAPALPARRTATTKATDPKIAIEDLNEEANQQNDEKIFQVGKSSEASNEVQASNNETQEKIETALPTKVFKTSFNTQECEQDKQDDIQEHFKTPDSNNKIVDEASETITSDVTLTIAGAPQKARSRVKIMPHLKVARNTSVLKSTTSEPEIIPSPAFEEPVKEIRPETPVFTTLSGMASPPPCHTPQPPQSPAPGNPFLLPHPHPHPRIRTESLCSMKSNFSAYKDMGGVVRKNFRSEETQRIIDTKRESRMRLSNKDLDKTQLRMFDMIYWNPTTSPMKAPVQNLDAKRMERSKSVSSMASLEADDEDLDRPATFVVPQLMFGPNGEMVLDEKSLVIENEQQKQNRILLASSNVVYDDELSGNYGYYKRQKRTRDWSPEETVKFYRCLQTVGTDFSLMLTLFTDTNRTRRDLKLKFKKEERSNLALINKALMHPNSFDIDELKQELEAEENAKKLLAETKVKNEIHERLKKEILKKHEAKKAKLTQKHKLSQVEQILNELPSPESNSQATSETKENQVQVRTSKRRKIKIEPVPVQLVKDANDISDTSIPEQKVTANHLTVKVPVIKEIISKKTEEILDLDINKQPTPVKCAPAKLPAFDLLKSPPQNANFETFVDQQGNRFECELRNDADPPLVIEYTEDTFKMTITKEHEIKDMTKKDFKITLKDSDEKDAWTPEMDYSKISVEDLQVVMDVNEIAETQLKTKNVLNQNVENENSILTTSNKEAGTSSSSEKISELSTMMEAFTSCDPQEHQIICPNKELTTQPDVSIVDTEIEMSQTPEDGGVPVVPQEIPLPICADISDNKFVQPQFETKEVLIEEQQNKEHYPVETEMQPGPSQDYYNPQQHDHENYEDTSECFAQPDDLEETSMMDTISEFVNNFDLSSLVLIETEVDGETIQEVHTIDPTTEKVSSEPIDCPAAIKDYLIKHMQGGEESDDEEEDCE